MRSLGPSRLLKTQALSQDDKSTKNYRAYTQTASGGFLAWGFGFYVAVFGGGVFDRCVDLSTY